MPESWQPDTLVDEVVRSVPVPDYAVLNLLSEHV